MERKCWNLEALLWLYHSSNGMRLVNKCSRTYEINGPNTHKAVPSIEFNPPLELTGSLQTDERVDQIFLKQKREKSSAHFLTPVLLVVAKLTEHFVRE